MLFFYFLFFVITLFFLNLSGALQMHGYDSFTFNNTFVIICTSQLKYLLERGKMCQWFLD